MELRIEVFGEQQASRELLRFSQRVDDMSPAFEAVADEFLRLEHAQFATEGGYASGGWRPLAPSTVARKARLRLDPRILHATLRLRRSLTERGPDHVRRIGPSELFVGSRVPYGVYHQHGTHRMPRRRPVEFTERDKANMVRVIQRFIVHGET